MNHFFSVITDSWFWRYFFSHFGWVDWALVFFIFIGILLGLKNGLNRELPRLLETMISLYVTMEYYHFFAAWLARETPWAEAYTQVFTFAAVGLVSWFVLRLLFEIVGRFAHLEVASPFQWVGGMVVGGVRYFLFFSLVSYFLVLFPLDWIHRSYQVQSWSGQTLSQTPSKIHGWINESILRRIRV